MYIISFSYNYNSYYLESKMLSVAANKLKSFHFVLEYKAIDINSSGFGSTISKFITDPCFNHGALFN